jgi:putative FmdB family regulatory protein
MPIYEYGCDACGHRFEAWQRMSEPPFTACASCGAARVSRLISATSFSLKGNGWYLTDYARKGQRGPDGAKGKENATAPKEASVGGR